MALLTVAELKDQLNIPSANTTYDAEMQTYVDAVPAVVEKIIGGPAENRTVVETVHVTDGGRAISLALRPFVSLTSISANGTALGITDVYPGPAGRVLRRSSGAAFAPTTRPVVVTYVAGLGVTAPPAAKLAAKMIGAHLWKTQRGSAGPTGPGGDGATAVPGLGYAVPNRALDLLSPWTPETGWA